MEIFQLYFTDVKKDFNSTLISEQLYYRFPVTSNDRREGKPHYKLFRWDEDGYTEGLISRKYMLRWYKPRNTSLDYYVLYFLCFCDVIY